MQHPVKKYHGWLLEEKDKSRKYKEKEDRAKVVFKPIDDSSFLVKYKRQAIIDGQKRLNGQPTIQGDKVVLPDPAYLNAGWKETLSFLRRATTEGKGPSSELMSQIESVGKTMIAVYEVSRKLLTPNRIVITYSLYKKSDFKPVIADVNITTLDADTAGKYATTPEIAAKIRDRVLNIDSQAEVIAQQIQREEEAAAKDAATKGDATNVSSNVQSTGEKITVDAEISFEKLRYASSTGDLFKIVNSTISKISKYAKRGDVKDVSENAAFKKCIEELKNRRMGTYTIAVLSALKKAYGIITEDEYGDPEDRINQQFADKLSNIINAPELKVGESLNYVLDPLGKFLISSKLYETLDNPVTLAELLGGSQILSDFIAALKVIKTESSTSTSTPEELSKITYPIKFGTISDDVKKVQKLMIDKFKNTGLKQASSQPWYNNVVNSQKYAGDGEYGSSTRGAVEYLKRGFKLASKDVDGNTITKELVDALYSYK
jgi:hypothetical protein